jgi:hypothetical protein
MPTTYALMDSYSFLIEKSIAGGTYVNKMWAIFHFFTEKRATVISRYTIFIN